MQQLGERRVTPGSDLPATPLPAALHGHQGNREGMACTYARQWPKLTSISGSDLPAMPLPVTLHGHQGDRCLAKRNKLTNC